MSRGSGLAEGTIVPGRAAAKKPRYIELADQLRARILDGQFAEPEVFPTESELCEAHGVSRFTVREALRRLQTEGLIARRRGSGTVIQPAAARAGALHQPLSNVGEILQYARDTRIQFEHVGETRISRQRCEQIGIDPQGIWYLLRGIRTRQGDQQPIAVTEAYLHADLIDAARRIDTSRSTIFQQVEELTGASVARVTQDIQAVAASAEVAGQLGVPRRSPCLRIMRCYLDERGRIFEISVSHHPGDRFAYAMHIEVDG
jgi:DNA-binding GntR family transcriptional regulator